LSDILLAVDRGDFAVLVLLDLSAAFDTVDHDILLVPTASRIELWDRRRRKGLVPVVSVGPNLRRHAVACRSPDLRRSQGLVLGPVLFMYVADLAALVECHGLTPHQYADDTQIYGSCSPSYVDDLLSTISGYVNDVADWMQSNRLQLNPGKTELLWCTTCRRQNRLPTATLTVGSSTVSPLSSVRDPGIFVDINLVMRTHVCQTVSRCLALRQLRSIRHLVSATVFQSLVTYCFSS